jgi:hypothetical protein
VDETHDFPNQTHMPSLFPTDQFPPPQSPFISPLGFNMGPGPVMIQSFPFERPGFEMRHSLKGQVQKFYQNYYPGSKKSKVHHNKKIIIKHDRNGKEMKTTIDKRTQTIGNMHMGSYEIRTGSKGGFNSVMSDNGIGESSIGDIGTSFPPPAVFGGPAGFGDVMAGLMSELGKYFFFGKKIKCS